MRKEMEREWALCVLTTLPIQNRIWFERWKTGDFMVNWVKAHCELWTDAGGLVIVCYLTKVIACVGLFKMDEISSFKEQP